MDKNCISCGSCGAPLESPSDFALVDTTSEFCKYCTDEKGKLSPFEKILEGTAKFYVDSQGLNPDAARNMAKEMLLEMPAWRKKP